ncbi:M14 family zinc carboxypeptidase [Polaromonas sp. SM01]|uniref:M14 family zinc carboxypeptidase n=1 Tax=Polaromonas sp. SM01 TaxID=3085630 RepID=UPI002981D75A|nr:M14 family zinc carboxypeptidase [Polaromonas sp. SM01]MDW5443460.1 M14 family zinc carboxypeptidase [Polaromonas sp. SM01]
MHDSPPLADAHRLSRTPDAGATFAEHEDFKALLLAGAAHLEVHEVAEVHTAGPSFPVYTASIGSSAPDAPALGFFGGIHGLERIGTQLILHYLRALLFRLAWDTLLQQQLQKIRLIFMPIVNPGGMWAQQRANPRGVDLMRNAPHRAEYPVPFLAGGQTWSPWLPWYCGRPGAPLETESAALLQVVREQLACRPFSLALDCHSGYGFSDSLWFPYAKTRRLMPHLAEMWRLKTMLKQSHPHHDYRFEPQSKQYLLHGDLWDHAYEHTPAGHVFLPMTLELGSWLWIRKNPRQLLSKHGIFNPIKTHRTQRVLRRHADLLDFLTRVAFAAPGWLPQAEQRERLLQQATAHWRPERPGRTA